MIKGHLEAINSFIKDDILPPSFGLVIFEGYIHDNINDPIQIMVLSEVPSVVKFEVQIEGHTAYFSDSDDMINYLNRHFPS